MLLCSNSVAGSDVDWGEAELMIVRERPGMERVKEPDRLL